MRKEVLKFLACPVCKGSLKFDGKIVGDRIKSGVLYCPSCDIKYEILDEIPVFQKEIPKEIEESYNKAIKDLEIILKKRLNKDPWEYWWKHKKPYKDYFPKEMWDKMMRGEEKFAQDVASFKSNIIIDIGTGSGKLIERVSRLIREETLIIGIEIDEDVLRDTKRRLENNKLYKQVSLIVCDAKKLPFKNSFADLVVSLSGFDNIIDPFGAFKESNRILLEKGNISFTCMLLDEESESYRLAQKYNVISLCTYQKIKDILKSSGFKIKSIEQMISGKHPGVPYDLFPIKDDWFAKVKVFAEKLS